MICQLAAFLGFLSVNESNQSNKQTHLWLARSTSVTNEKTKKNSILNLPLNPFMSIANGFQSNRTSTADQSNSHLVMERIESRAASRSHQTSPAQSPRLSSSSFTNGYHNSTSHSSGAKLFQNFWGQLAQTKKVKRKGREVWYKKTRVKRLVGLICFVSFFLSVNWFLLLRLQGHGVELELRRNQNESSRNSTSVSVQLMKTKKNNKRKKQYSGIYGRMLALAAHALAEGQNKREPKDLWQEPFVPASAWRPCADQHNWEANDGKNGYIRVTANGGINQQRVAICNAVVVARLLNATLVVPKFMYSSVWRDVSQFGDIYQEEHFINYLTPDIRIVKELPKELQSLDLDAIGSVVSDVDMSKESKPSFYLKNILPILLKNGVVHFIGFGNRLSFDPIPSQLQRLRCRCNFHALRFAPKIQEIGALIIQRLRGRSDQPQPLDPHLVGPYAESMINNSSTRAAKSSASRYLALHLRFEIDMVAHSLCEYGGGDKEREELEEYRRIHFPALTVLKETGKLPSPEALRSEGLCPLTPEESVLMLAALGFNRKTHIFVAGAQIYGGTKRLAALTSLYPNLVTKENVLSSAELEPLMNFSSQLAALDFIACTASDVFAMTDSGSQLSSLVSGYRIYYGGGKMPTIRPNKRRLADIFVKNNTIEWKVFEQRVRKAVRQTKHVQSRPKGRSVYRYPRCRECMCRDDLP